ncbi:hypothetical protein E1A91_A07G010000v1 [Gossypium mustelinum]|uniref:Uncharacterized protein n=1 Tax=Gossypium mustelinum TaxID=34275 RepID=A0A5D2YGC3_GOSMU|nr:hypothetical protein E1A91_A07G010000v1 [Gossypium mustelinum]
MEAPPIKQESNGSSHSGLTVEPICYYAGVTWDSNVVETSKFLILTLII